MEFLVFLCVSEFYFYLLTLFYLLYESTAEFKLMVLQGILESQVQESLCITVMLSTPVLVSEISNICQVSNLNLICLFNCYLFLLSFTSKICLYTHTERGVNFRRIFGTLLWNACTFTCSQLLSVHSWYA